MKVIGVREHSFTEIQGLRPTQADLGQRSGCGDQVVLTARYGCCACWVNSFRVNPVGALQQLMEISLGCFRKFRVVEGEELLAMKNPGLGQGLKDGFADRKGAILVEQHRSDALVGSSDQFST